MSPRGGPQTGMDAALWIDLQIKHGHHVVHLVASGLFMTHPGCADPAECEFTGRTWRKPAGATPFYVAAIDKDGIVGPDRKASWGDVVARVDGDRA